MNEMIYEILIWALRLILTGIGTYITYLINKHIKNENLKRIALSINEAVQNAALSTQQTYVDALKKQNIFDKAAQKQALSIALTTCKANLTDEAKKWLEANHKDVDAYLTTMLEAAIKIFKK